MGNAETAAQMVEDCLVLSNFAINQGWTPDRTIRAVSIFMIAYSRADEKPRPDKDLTDGLHDMWEDLDRKDRAKLRRYSHVETILQPPTGIPLKALPKKMPGEKKCPKCFSCCAENPEWLLRKFGIKEGDCHKCKHYKACFKAY
jgi:hypothetical protein